ncbi:ABC transporter permease [Bosea sp. (in: a-proteobacteria)]|uniref:ABC transporter permease n=1 Tax=Bosea sp. (in: a-proteobacteria) TaxID=1871050 RepID=UPI002633B316|nr:ABC transporter permease [Bosea sp. (in: a-proteobacteria)]MCO5089588.1 ABC transporter permease [Bosea sp. (in: a-proteobacteria)]
MIPTAMQRGLAAFSLFICVCAVSPVLVIIIESFTSANYVVFPPPGFSIKWYIETFKRPEFMASLMVSLIVAVFSSLVATALGTITALGLVRREFLGRKLLQQLFMMPLSLPGLIFGLSLLQFFAMRAISINVVTLVIAHIIITTPFAIRFVSTAILGVNPEVERAAQSLGADRFRTFWHITMPLIRPGVVASLVFTFILSFDEVAASLFLSSPTATTLPVRIYVYIDQNYDPLITAISSILAFAAATALVIIEFTIGMDRLFGLRRA